jgi:hypothetical protein
MTFGADAVGGVLSTVVVPVTVLVTVLVSAFAFVLKSATQEAVAKISSHLFKDFI